MDTIRLLLDSLSEEHRNEVFTVIFLADFDETHKYNSLKRLSTEFQKFIDQSLLHVIFAPRDYYPPLSNLKKKYGDSQQRISWRSKLVVDFSFIMCYCKDLSQYYLHLEDDLIPSPSFYPKLRDFIASQKQPWAMLDAASMGHTAKVYHSSDLENVAAYFYLLYDEMPVDWLMIFWRQIKYHANSVLPAASLFQHVGHNSSLEENKRSHKAKENYFDEYDIKYRGLNPAAIVSSSMDSEKGTKPEHAYNKGAGYFWAKGVTKDKVILFKFINSIALREVFVETGSYLAPKDKLKSGVLQASFEMENARMEENSTQVCSHFETISSFKDGRVKVTLNKKRKLSCLRILVTDNQQEWLFLREVDIWQK